MKNEEKSNINNLENSISVNNNLENNIDINQKKNSKLYLFVFLVDEEVGNSVLIKAFHELNEENQENHIFLNRINAIKIELSEIIIAKEIDKIINQLMELYLLIIFRTKKN